MSKVYIPLVWSSHNAGCVLIVPRLCPWYFQCVVMYAGHGFCRFTGIGTGAELLGELRTILLQSTSDSFSGVLGLYCRIGDLPKKAALYFCYEGCRVLLCTEGALCVSIDCYNPTRSGHLELEIGVVWHRIESSEYGLS